MLANENLIPDKSTAKQTVRSEIYPTSDCRGLVLLYWRRKNNLLSLGCAQIDKIRNLTLMELSELCISREMMMEAFYGQLNLVQK